MRPVRFGWGGGSGRGGNGNAANPASDDSNDPREGKDGSLSRTRTCDHSINSRTLYQLSYQGPEAPKHLGGRPYSNAIPVCEVRTARYRAGMWISSGAEALLLAGELQLVEAEIAAATGDKLVVAAAFDDTAAIDDADAVGVHDRL